MARIVLVEDDVEIRRLVADALAGQGHDVESAAAALEGLELAVKGKPDLVVMDVHMERVGGIAATEQLKTAFPSARIIILSKHKDTDIQTAARAAGACAYFIKDDLTALRTFLLSHKSGIGNENL